MKSHRYEKKYLELFQTERGRQVLEEVIELVGKQTAEFSALEVIERVCAKRQIADSWMVLNALDHLMTLGVLRELTTGQNILGQHRRFVSVE